MNSAYRDVIFVNDLTLFRSWILALFVAVIAANIMEDMGLFGDMGLRRQTFAPIAAIVGGYVFGLGIVMAGGCGSGILYKIGEGTMPALVATLGYGMALVATYHGPLKPVLTFFKSYKVSIGEGDEAIANPALWDIFGTGAGAKWIVIAVIAIAFAIVVLKGKPFVKAKKGWSWSLGGALVGVVVVAALWASYYWGGQTRGLSAAGPTAEAFLLATLGDSMAKFDPMFDFWGLFKGSWSALYVFGIPLGAYISAKGLKEFKLTVPREAEELLRTFMGGLVMGFGAAIAGG
jgi:hypothetical protein